ncbi:hypothetical protein K443DRAFT_199615 [Laccaria amethystina LaAM-08-1]|uniref:2-dehydropantoate 2-reductase n=1 Tax=Laccaria amethystina LaAM-08-1 TaxID=1095629 RepID=A0A0C9XQ51_9AGAR|nr:hypothetical protein K443DRAFT_199615 [Laccaria amethystina LaAM-08-1]
MHFHVLGLGPIGSLLSCHLRRSLPPSHSVSLIYKTFTQAQDATARGGILHVDRNAIVTNASGFELEASMSPSTAEGESVDAVRNQEIHSLFITTKAHQTLPAIQKLLPRISANSTIVLLQNGMGIYEELISEIFRNPEHRPHFILTSNTHGAFLRKPNHVVHSGLGSIEFAIVPDPGGKNFEKGFEETSLASSPQPRLSDITSPGDPGFTRYESLRATVAALLLLKPLDVSWKPMPQLQLALRRKLAVNAVINPLTAIIGCRNGDIFSSPSSHHILDSVCREASDAYAAQVSSETKEWLQGLSVQGINVENEMVPRLPLSLTQARLKLEVLRVAKLTKRNKSSMLDDILRGRATEIKYINGYLLKLGNMYQIPMPTNEMLKNLVELRSDIPLDQGL